MKYYYFDAGVTVKAYLWEEGTEDVRQVIRVFSANPAVARVVTSRLALVETVSAVSRRTFDGEITEDRAEEVWNRLVVDFAGYDVSEPKPQLAGRAAELARRYRLRALAAIHLATGLAVRGDVPPEPAFSSCPRTAG